MSKLFATLSTVERHKYIRGLGDFLKSRLRGQDAALEELSTTICEIELIHKQPVGKPKAAFFCVGATGTGKTESAKLATEYLYGNKQSWRHGGCFGVFDMAEYADEGAILRLLGRNKEEQGALGDAIDALNARGGGLLLFDEIEKAHLQVSKTFLALLDEGRITMSNGLIKSVENCYIICTSNIGSAKAAEMTALPDTTIHRTILNEARKFFAPEWMARFSKTIVFMRLSRQVQVAICRDYLPTLLKDIAEECNLREIRFGTDVLALLASLAYSDTAGARFVQTTLKSAVGRAVLNWLDSTIASPVGKFPVLVLRQHPKTKSIHLEEVEAPCPLSNI